jgi:hypothetical protein
VIGVVSSIRHTALDQTPGLEIYLSGGALASADFLVVRSNRPFAGLGQKIRRAVAAIDPNQPVFLKATMSKLIDDSLSDRRFIVTLLGTTGCLAYFFPQPACTVLGPMLRRGSRRRLECGWRSVPRRDRSKP